MNNEPSIIKLNDSQYIAYHKFEGKQNKPGVVFLGGFMSDMAGTKAVKLEEYCKKNEYSYLRFDYFGHGESSGKFIDGTIGKFKESAIIALDQLVKGPQILVGSSLGGWLMNLIALDRPERVAGMIGIASAPDFTENLILKEMSDAEKKQMQESGVIYIDSDYSDERYPITKNLIEEGKNHLILKNNIAIHCPVWLVHGLKDDDVPSDLSVMLGQQLMSDNVRVNLIPDGDHRMSTDKIINVICNMLDDMMNII